MNANRESKPSASLLSEVRAFAGDVPQGTRATGLLCPVCSGGRTGEKSFGVSVTDTGTVFYRCFRLRCGVHGRLHDTVSPRTASSSGTPRKQKPPPAQVDTSKLLGLDGSLWGRKLFEYFGISSVDTSRANWRVAAKGTADETLYIPIYSPLKTLRGYEQRPFASNNGPKCRSTVTVDQALDPVWAGFFEAVSPSLRRPMVIVEDCISALKVSRFTDAYALIGTHISTDKALEINDMSVGRGALLCLDKDATDHAVETVKKLRWVCPALRMVPIKKDLKYYSNTELLELFNV